MKLEKDFRDKLAEMFRRSIKRNTKVTIGTSWWGTPYLKERTVDWECLKKDFTKDLKSLMEQQKRKMEHQKRKFKS